MSKKEVSVLVKPTATAEAGTTKAIDDLRKEVQGRSFSDGARILEAVDLVAGTNRIPHGLGKRPKGYLVVGRRDVEAAVVSETRIVSAAAYLPLAIASWTVPGASTDYWTSTATTTMTVPLPLKRGETITGVGVNFYRGQAVDPTIRLLSAQNGASASVLSATVAWTAPSAGTTWEVLTASYSEAVGDALTPNVFIDITCRNTDRIRAAYVTVTRAPDAVAELSDEHDSHTDTDKFLYLVADGYAATVDLLIF